ncbi:hypothetical protein AN401_14195 [Zobellella denitrificans]|uniref:Uncharacterized protein n=1 Tax=Zobellella denitrificans TaxID=347534 RepID=A0A291HRT8_9GAMM|nr:hypothetical protein [Zobellella denitrificans]ATG74865.1 hypothetical protein AN401_14195 [Zobellella denitrificans]
MAIECKHCHTAVVFVTESTLNDIKKLLQPNIKTLSTQATAPSSSLHAICPRCDAYALGLDLNTAFPIILQNGQQTTIHELDLW